MKLAAAQIIKSGSFERVATTGGGDEGNGRRASSIDYPHGGRAPLGKNRPGLNATDAAPAGGRVVRETGAGRHIWRAAASRAARTEWIVAYGRARVHNFKSHFLATAAPDFALPPMRGRCTGARCLSKTERISPW